MIPVKPRAVYHGRMPARLHAAVVLAVVAALSGPLARPGAAQSTRPGAAVAQSANHSDARSLRADAADGFVQAARIYRESLDSVLKMHEADVTRTAELEARAVDLERQGMVSRRELETTMRLAAAARVKAEETRREIAQADQLVAEAEARRQLALLPPPRPEAYQASTFIVRYDGTAPWSLAVVDRVSRFFESQFGRPLPISALGQSPLHDKLGFDHRNAVDLALHPDSREGRAVLDYLRAQHVPFLAYRGAVPGAASGAHIHVGLPSLRLGALR
jgi:hypothetical protein